MKIGKLTAVFLSVVFFFILASIIAISIVSIFKGFSFSQNPIIRITFLIVNILITRKYYEYIYKTVENKEGKAKLDTGRKIAVISIITILIVIIGTVFFMNI